jgi:uncharacterized membrane protein YoaK (UPF0700 family)
MQAMEKVCIIMFIIIIVVEIIKTIISMIKSIIIVVSCSFMMGQVTVAE